MADENGRTANEPTDMDEEAELERGFNEAAGDQAPEETRADGNGDDKAEKDDNADKGKIGDEGEDESKQQDQSRKETGQKTEQTAKSQTPDSMAELEKKAVEAAKASVLEAQERFMEQVRAEHPDVDRIIHSDEFDEWVQQQSAEIKYGVEHGDARTANKILTAFKRDMAASSSLDDLPEIEVESEGGEKKKFSEEYGRDILNQAAKIADHIVAKRLKGMASAKELRAAQAKAEYAGFMMEAMMLKPDALQVRGSKPYQEWLGKQSEAIRLLERSSPQGMIDVQNAYAMLAGKSGKDEPAGSTKESERQKTLHSESLRAGLRRKEMAQSAEEEFDEGFDAAVEKSERDRRKTQRS